MPALQTLRTQVDKVCTHVYHLRDMKLRYGPAGVRTDCVREQHLRSTPLELHTLLEQASRRSAPWPLRTALKPLEKPLPINSCTCSGRRTASFYTRPAAELYWNHISSASYVPGSKPAHLICLPLLRLACAAISSPFLFFMRCAGLWPEAKSYPLE